MSHPFDQRTLQQFLAVVEHRSITAGGPPAREHHAGGLLGVVRGTGIVSLGTCTYGDKPNRRARVTDL